MDLKLNTDPAVFHLVDLNQAFTCGIRTERPCFATGTVTVDHTAVAGQNADAELVIGAGGHINGEILGLQIDHNQLCLACFYADAFIVYVLHAKARTIFAVDHRNIFQRIGQGKAPCRIAVLGGLVDHICCRKAVNLVIPSTLGADPRAVDAGGEVPLRIADTVGSTVAIHSFDG